MEDINEKAYDDELNKAEESIERTPREKIKVPKVKTSKDKDNNNGR